jgi:hypothetical protein
MTDREPVEEGGDPACWAHLFEDDDEDDRAEGVRDEGDAPAPPDGG